MGVESSMLFMLAGLALAIFTMLTVFGTDTAPIVTATPFRDRPTVEPVVEIDIAPPSTNNVPAGDRTATETRE